MMRRSKRTDLRGLESLALAQGGYFDRRSAARYGISGPLLSYHARTGRFERVAPGVYRLHVAPVDPRDELFLAWVWSNHRGAISHESALALYGLSDVMPSRIHLTVPPDFRRQRLPGFHLHRSRLRADEVVVHEGICVTVPSRAIVESASDGTDPEQIQTTVRQALDRGLVNPEQLSAAARRPGYRYRRTVRPLIDAAASRAAA